MARLDPSVLPTVTDEHRRAAFEAMRWTGWTYDAAMADATRRQIVETRAHQIRKQEWKANAARPYLRGAIEQLRQQPYRPIRLLSSRTTTDVKRAAAGDLDD